MVFASDALPVDDLDSIVLVRIVLKIAVVHSSILAFTQDSRRQNDLNLVAWKGDNFTARFERCTGRCSLVCFVTAHTSFISD